MKLEVKVVVAVLIISLLAQTSLALTCVMGDVVELSKSNDLLEIREPVGDVRETITEFDLDMLRRGNLQNQLGDFEYYQFIRLDTNPNTLLSPYTTYGRSNEPGRDVADYLFFPEGQQVENESFYQYEISFNPSFKTYLTESSTSGELEIEGLKGEQVYWFSSGSTASTISSATTVNHDGTWGVKIDLVLGMLTDTLREGETKKYEINGKQYNVTAVSIPHGNVTNETAQFTLNGELTPVMVEGGYYTLLDGSGIAVGKILTNARDGIAEYYLLAHQISIYDDSVSTPDTYNAGVYYDGQLIVDGKVSINAGLIGASGSTPSVGDQLEMSKIKYRPLANSGIEGGVYVPKGGNLTSHLSQPEGLLNPYFNWFYEGIVSDYTNISVTPNSQSSQYSVSLTNMQGHQYNIPLYSAYSGKIFPGDGLNTLVWQEPVDAQAILLDSSNGEDSASLIGSKLNIAPGSVFLVSDMREAYDRNALSHFIQFNNINSENNKITFVDLASGSFDVNVTQVYGAWGVLGSFSMIVDGNDYIGIIGNQSLGFRIAVDLNGDGDIGDYAAGITDAGMVGAEKDEARFTVLGGGVLDLGEDGNGSAFYGDAALRLETVSSVFDEDDGFEAVLFNISSATGSLELLKEKVNYVRQNRLVYPWQVEQRDDVSLVLHNNPVFSSLMTDYGVRVEHSSVQQGSLFIQYPSSQVGSQVFLVGMTGLCSGYCLDADGDGFAPVGYNQCPSYPSLDCNDNNAYVKPGAKESCNGID
ncbi:MAG: putative metal-binding motif-containing protein, partial [Candidatus Woesearchaeota archaeon]